MSVYYYGYPDVKADDRWTWWEQNPPSAVAIDVETISIDERHPLGIGIAFSPKESFYFDLYPEPPMKGLEALSKIVRNIRTTKIMHNAVFDMGIFPLIPLVGEAFDRANIFDTNIAARLLGYKETSLPILGAEFNCFTRNNGEIMKENGCSNNLQLIEKNRMALADHCAADTKATYTLYLEWKQKIYQRFGEYFKVEMETIPILQDMSMHGIAIDQAKRQELEDRYTTEVEFYRRYIQDFGISNPGSPMQVGYTLAKRGNFLKFTSPKRRQLRTREKDLEFLDDPLASAIIAYRHKSKFLNTYLLPLRGEDRFYSEYYMETDVGRLNSRNRNMQNIPGENEETGDPGARSMLMPDNRVFTTGDFSREHLYILANMSQDREMLSVLYNLDPLKADIHQHTANLMGIPRKLAKTVNFAVIYGATAETLMEQLKTRDRSRCNDLLEGWFRTYRGAADWLLYAQQQGLKDGWALPTVFGRRIRLPDNESESRMRNKCSNYPILGSDGEICKRALILCRNRGLGPKSKFPLTMTVHDSITWDGDVLEKIPKEELENIPGFRVPFEIRQTFRWE
jgi:DNA polymerase I-like protein with 3'-5' exonuclease and polymerase domains